MYYILLIVSLLIILIKYRRSITNVFTIMTSFADEYNNVYNDKDE